MTPHPRRLIGVLLGATCLVAPQAALAQSTSASERETQLEARLERLEAEMQLLREDLARARSDQQRAESETRSALAAAQTQSADAVTRVARIEDAAPAAAAASGKDGFDVGATTFKLGGYVRVNAIASRWSSGDVAPGALGKEFYLPQHIPVGDGAKSQDFMMHARQTRITMGASTPLEGRELSGYIEFDFGLATAPPGAQRATNPYVPTFRRGFIKYGNLLIGQEWSTFQNVAALPETTDFVGPTEGTVFNRQAMVRYTHKVADQLSFAVAVENPQTEALVGDSAGFADLDDDRMPDLVGRINWTPGLGSFVLAGVAREIRVQQGGLSDSAFGWGLSGSGIVPFGPEGRHDLRFMVTYGQGIGRYLGLGYVADAVLPAFGEELAVIDNFAAFAALKLGWTDKLRSTFMAGYQDADYPDAIVVNGLANKRAWSMAANLFWSPADKLDFGVEYRHAVRETVSGADGSLDRMEFAAKYRF